MSTEAPIPGSPEHAAAMVALAEAEGVQVRVLDSQGRNSIQEVIEEVRTLEVPTDNASANPETAPEVDPNAPQENPAFQEFYKEFAETGDVAEASKAKILEITRKSGIPDAMVEAYIAGQKALKSAESVASQAETNKANAEAFAQAEAVKAGFAAAGGEQAYTQMTQWAKANMSEAEIKAFNSQVEGSKESALLAIEGLKARWSRATGQVPGRTVTGDARGNGSGLSGFSSQDEMVAAMSDKRYSSDSKYRQQVAQRLALTNDGVTGTRIR